MDWTIDIRFWKTTSSARMLSLVLIARISRRDSSRWLSREMTVLCQISSYCCLKPRSSSRTVLLRMSRKVVVFCSCFFSTFEKASRRILDCSSMYFRESVEFVSRSWRRRETALKKDSCIVGREEAAEEVLVVLFLTELVVFWDLDGVAMLEVDGIEESEAELVVFDALATVDEDSLIEDDSVDEDLSGCEAWVVVVDSVRFPYGFTAVGLGLDVWLEAGMDVLSELVTAVEADVSGGASEGRQMSSGGLDPRSKV
jgi:hypothetical protein